MKLSKFHKPSVKYKSHQVDALRLLAKENRFLLSNPTGTGKTLISLSAIAYSLEHNTITRAIFVVEPKNAQQTANEVMKYFDGIPTLVMTGKSKKSRTGLYSQFVSNPEHRVMIINYELVKNDISEISKIFHYHKVALIADEATKLKNKTSQVHKVMARLFSLAQRGICLTATPVTNSVQDIHSILQCLSVNVVSDFEFFTKFVEWEIKTFGRRKVRSIKAYKDVDKYKDRISKHFYSKKKSDILDISFAFSKRFLALDDLEKDALKALEDSENVAHVAIATSCPSLILKDHEDLLSEKERDLMDYIDNDLDNKMLVYSPFKTVIKRLEKLLNDKYGKDFAVSIHGDVTDPEPIKNKIINNPKTRILLGTSSLEKGMDGIQAVVDTEYMFTLPITAGAFLQLLGRTSREGGKYNMVTVVIPIMGGINSIDFDLWILIQNQLRLIQQVTPDSLEEGCIDPDMDQYMPEGNIEDPTSWLKSKIRLSQGQELKTTKKVKDDNNSLFVL